MIYVRFGTASWTKVASYERARRPKRIWGREEKLIWEKQFKSPFFVNNYPESSVLFSEILKNVTP